MQAGAKPQARARAIAPWAAIAIALAYAALTQWLYEPPEPLPPEAPAEVFSAQRAALQLRELVGNDVPHPLASAADARIRAQILARLAALDIPAELHSGWVCDTDRVCGYAVNIVARLAGQEPASGAVLLAAHYDSVPAGPGAGDDGVGVAAILEIARALKQQPALRHPVILLIDEGEEAGLLGARLFVAEDPAARTVRAAVNLDARGDAGPSLMFETGSATDFSMRLYAAAVARPMSNSLYYFIYKLLPNDTDFTVFKAAGYQGFNFALIGGIENYHTPRDTLARLDFGSLQHQGQNALQVVQALGHADLAQPPAGGAVFFDIFGRKLLHWPAGWAPWIGGALLLALLLALWRLAPRTDASAIGVVHGLAALLASWAGAVVVAAALLALLRFAGSVPPAAAYSWAAYPGMMHAACVALALLVPAGGRYLCARRSRPWDLWLANVALYALLLLLCSLWVAELSFLFLAPVLAALVAALLALRQAHAPGGARRVPPVVAMLPVLGAAFAFVPSLLLLYIGLGTDAWPILTAVLGLAALGLAPLLGDPRSRSHRAYLGINLLVVVLGATLSLLRPAYSSEMPQRTLIWYALDADPGRARWIVQPDSKRDPPEIPFDAGGGAAGAAAHAARRAAAGATLMPAPRLDYPAPRLQLLSAAAHAGGIVYRVRVQSARGAPEVGLAVRQPGSIRALYLIDGARRLPVRLGRAADRSGRLYLIGAGESGAELEIDSNATAPLAVQLLDRSYGLPAAGERLRALGATLTTPSQDGDLTIVYRSLALGALQAAPGL